MLAMSGELRDIQKAFISHNSFRCEFCARESAMEVMEASNMQSILNHGNRIARVLRGATYA
jgi:aerobic-type carbon monoxide dehydrogenase small subunit (CoxS/CutS family)